MVEGWGPSVRRRDSYSPTYLSAHAPASLILIIIVIMLTFIGLCVMPCRLLKPTHTYTHTDRERVRERENISYLLGT